ncbi:isoform B [Senna tora]|uniref:Isoform B n=1 Tax=Senna tora TaxID=362788 RepID=A0A834SPH8_9FABA|nr:isoform B [Senna tora]
MHILPASFSKLSAFYFHPPRNPRARLPYTRPQTLRILCAKRVGKQRYPSEKKKLKSKHKEILQDLKDKNKFEGTWRLYKLGVPVDKDPGKDFLEVSDGLLEAIAKVLEFPVASLLPREAFTVVRKSFDARKKLKEPKFVHTVDMDVKKLLSLEPRTWDFISRLEPKVGLVEHMDDARDFGDLMSIIHDCKENNQDVVTGDDGNRIFSGDLYQTRATRKPKIAVVGSGPSGLFAALVLAEFGADVTLIERGQAVEKRGRDIGALVVRRILEIESNFCFGEGGAGTWSDGKLVTRIGRNSGSVLGYWCALKVMKTAVAFVYILRPMHELNSLSVMRTLVQFGAPKNILIDGKPHLGTDRLVPLLRNFRRHLQELGVSIKFGTRVDDLIIEDERVLGVMVSDSADRLRVNTQKMDFDAVILAVGHSARDIYQMLLSHNVVLVPKDFAVGLRIEHPQELINSIQYSELASEVHKGRGRVPVADYKVANYVDEQDGHGLSDSRVANRSCYSFCMCPGGQVVLTSTSPSELCVNGMSFSRRASRWANAALVVTVTGKDFEALNYYGPLAGVEFQREFERRAAMMGGGNFTVPVQTVTDFLDKKLSVTSVPPSSYRLGVKAANLHQLFPVHLTEALQHSVVAFDRELPGFISKEALLHGVETRTSSPIQIPRSADTYESTSLKGLYPVGEGAGYAGGIISAAVDGMYAGFAVAKNLSLFHGDIESVLGKTQNAGFVKY